MSILEALALWRKVKPIIAWIKDKFPGVIDFLKSVSKDVSKNVDTTPVLPPNHPDRKLKYPDDWNNPYPS